MPSPRSLPSHGQPPAVRVQIAETEPGAKGNSAGGRVEKPATIATGAKIMVPIFIDIGEEVKIDTDEGKYLGRTSGPGKSF
jgi:elongation factor P